MRFGSLFTGIGGLDLGLERAGMECAWQVEIDDYATRVLERHWPDVRRWRDVWEFIGHADSDIESTIGKIPHNQPESSGDCGGLRVDLICGGFPCQPVSLAGARRGDADERWLWPAFRRVVELLDPSYVVIENVPGLISADAGRLFRGILRDLSQGGYDAEWQTLPAAAFGAPHLRERVFLVAYSHQELRGQERASKRIGQVDQSYDWRAVKPTVCRSNHGIPHRVDRLRGLGNAVVPQVAEWIGRRIMEHAQ